MGIEVFNGLLAELPAALLDTVDNSCCLVEEGLSGRFLSVELVGRLFGCLTSFLLWPRFVELELVDGNLLVASSHTGVGCLRPLA